MIMNDWENRLAAAFTYQDIADCTLGSIPAVSNLSDVKADAKETVLNLDEITLKSADILRKASMFLALVIYFVLGTI